MGPAVASAIEQRPVSTLIPYAKNARTHSPAQVTQIVASVTEFGFTNPILIDSEGVIIAGHGRVMAAKEMGLATVPCIVLGHLSPAQRQAYVIADNKLALNAGWDFATLTEQLCELDALDFDVALNGRQAGTPTSVSRRPADLLSARFPQET
jgi:ParB-like chromosome segregation protein Spo0J